MSLIFVVAAYNGATYYIDIFGRKLEKEVVKLRNEISQLQAENLLHTSLSNTSSNEVNEPEAGVSNSIGATGTTYENKKSQ